MSLPSFLFYEDKELLFWEKVIPCPERGNLPT